MSRLIGMYRVIHLNEKKTNKEKSEKEKGEKKKEIHGKNNETKDHFVRTNERWKRVETSLTIEERVLLLQQCLSNTITRVKAMRRVTQIEEQEDEVLSQSVLHFSSLSVSS